MKAKQSAARAEILSLRKAHERALATPFLPEAEWNLEKKAKDVPSWQLNHWLNYEYARSNRAIREAVEVIRSNDQAPTPREEGSLPPVTNLPRFAYYLEGSYPEFPEKPWLELAQEKRELRLKESAGIPAKNPFEDDILKSYDPEEFWLLAATGAITIDCRHPQDERFAIFQIDFTQPVPATLRHLEHWLKNRKIALQAKYKANDQEEPSGKHFGPERLFRVDPTKRAVGQRLNRRTILNRLRQLGALRLMKYYNLDSSEIVSATLARSLTPLFEDHDQGWTRPCSCAINFMRILTESWKHSFYPEFVLGTNNIDIDGGLFHHLRAGAIEAGDKDIGRGCIASFLDREIVVPPSLNGV